MGYKDPKKQSQYQTEWMANRRAKWLKENGPCVLCGATERLEVDHVDPTLKVHHKVWSWTETRRNLELAKCQVLCHDCHVTKTNADGSRAVGERSGKAKLSEKDVLAIRHRYAQGGVTLDQVGEPYGMDKRYIWAIVRRKTWTHI